MNAQTNTERRTKMPDFILCEPLQKLQKDLPPLFAGTELDNLTGKGYCWRTLQNEKSLGKVPEDVFLRSGSKKLLVVRDKFLAHWQSKITRQ
jgi:hypothetical protein